METYQGSLNQKETSQKAESKCELSAARADACHSLQEFMSGLRGPGGNGRNAFGAGVSVYPPGQGEEETKTDPGKTETCSASNNNDPLGEEPEVASVLRTLSQRPPVHCGPGCEVDGNYNAFGEGPWTLEKTQDRRFATFMLSEDD